MKRNLNFEGVTTAHPISLLLCALGGEGGGVLTNWLVQTAIRAGYFVQATSVPGVAQRTGATTYYIEIFPIPKNKCDGLIPVLGLYPIPGRLDALVSSELLETSRQISNGMSSSDRTIIVSSSSRNLTTSEKINIGDGRLDSNSLLPLVQNHSRSFHLLDMTEMTQQTGSHISAVMLGCIAASNLLPMTRDEFESSIRDSGTSVSANLNGFNCAFDAIEAQRKQTAHFTHLIEPVDQLNSVKYSPNILPIDANTLPLPALPTVTLGYARLLDYQDRSYAQLYLKRLNVIYASEQLVDPKSSHQSEITKEIARWLALWMAFDDVVRVADLKSRGLRMERVAREVKSNSDELIRVYDFFKPGIAELAGLLPRTLAQRLLTWEQGRVRRGLKPWALPLKVATHTLSGLIALRLISSLKALRLRGSRFALEESMIRRWLECVEQCTTLNWQLGYEIALCGRLIKGYGSTNERSKENLLHIIQHLAISNHNDPTSFADRCHSVRTAREAALKDEAGKELDKVLQQQGAPARPIKSHPIFWTKTSSPK